MRLWEIHELEKTAEQMLSDEPVIDYDDDPDEADEMIRKLT